MLDPISYEDKYKDTRFAEAGSQKALFMWANMAANFGLLQANDPESYKLVGYAQRNYYERGGPLIPQLKYLFAIHNQGHGDAKHGADAVAQGVKRGVPDVELPITISYFGNSPDDNKFTGCKTHVGTKSFSFFHAGLYIELKRKLVLKPGQRKPEIVVRAAGKASTEQEDWQAFLRGQGYACEICYGFEEARDFILAYLKAGHLI